MSDITFRPASPSDVEKAVPLILSSGPTAFAYVFANKTKTASDFLSFAFQSPGGEFSYDNHTVMILNDEVIGIGAVFSGQKAKSFTIKDGLKIVKFYGWRLGAVASKGLKTESVIKLPTKNETCLGHIAIAPLQRGRGYGQKLMEYLMSQVVLNNKDYFILDVSEENPRAMALYERMGFITKRHNLSDLRNEYGHVANHFRMERNEQVLRNREENNS